MASVFTRILQGDLPAHVVWSDTRCMGLLSIDPYSAGHTLVVPRQEVDQWVDAEPALVGHLVTVAQAIGVAQREAFGARRIGLMIQGYEVPHLHVHVWPSQSPADFLGPCGADDIDFAQTASTLRATLRAGGHGETVPAEA